MQAQEKGLRRGLALVLLAEVVVFSASFTKYFSGDGLYFFSHSPDFLRLDDLSTYRPLTLVLFRYLMEPIGGFKPLPYHLMALGAHLGATVLVYFLLKRVARSSAGVIAGLIFFGLHSTNFYITYGATFLPDFSMGLLAAGAFLAYASERPWLSLALYILALFCKESAVAIPFGIVTVGYLTGRDKKYRLPFLLVTVAYLVFQLYLHNGWLYPSGKSAYRFAVGPDSLWFKLKYLPWWMNLPSDWFRQRWWMLPPILLMIAPLLWTARRKWEAMRAEPLVLAACGVWGLAALAPALPVAQVPMKHNLYVPLMAAAVALSRCITRPVAKSVAWTMAVMFFAATAFQVRNDLGLSWVGEGSDITEASVDAVLRAYPVLPKGARFFILPTKVPGGINWYFDDESLFRRVYHDPSLRVFYADLGRLPPVGFEQQAGFLVFAYDRGRLYDVTASAKRDALDHHSYSLLPAISPGNIEAGLGWQPDELVSGKAGAVTYLAMGEDCRQTLVTLPQTRVHIPVEKLPPGALLKVAVAGAGKRHEAAMGRVLWSGTEVGRVFLEPGSESGQWWDGRIDLSPFAGQSGTLQIENTGDRRSDWLAWSRLRITPANDPFLEEETRAHPLESLGLPLLALAGAAKSETSIQWKESEIPGGRPAAMEMLERGGVERTSLVVLPRTTVRIDVPSVPAHSTLLIGAGAVGKQRDPAEGRLTWESNGQSRELARVMIEDTGAWWETSSDLSDFAGQSGTLVIENLGGRASDWIAWNRLRVVPLSLPNTETGGRALPNHGNPLLTGFSQADVQSDVAWTELEGKPASIQSFVRAGERHQGLLELPSARVRFPVTIPGQARLRFALSVADGSTPASEAAIDFESDGRSMQLFRAYLDRSYNGQRWQQREVDLSAFAGRSGTLVFRNVADRTRAGIVWAAVSLEEGEAKPPAPIDLLDLLETAHMGFDRTENYPNYDDFGTPGGKPAFIWWDNPARPTRLSLVTIAGTRAEFDLPSLPARASLVFAVSHGTGQGDGVRGKIFWNGELVYDRFVRPAMRDWQDAVVPLPLSAKDGGKLRIEVSSGPKRNTIGDWLAWSGLRIVPD